MASPVSQHPSGLPIRVGSVSRCAFWLMLVLCLPLCSLAKALAVGSHSTLVTVNAASYIPQLAPGAIAALFGNRFSDATQIAETVPLPTVLHGLSVRLVDSQNDIFSAPLFFISPGQINYLVPDQIALGEARVYVTQGTDLLAQGTLLINNSAPALFTCAANGKGEPAALTTSDGETFFAVADHASRAIKTAQPPQFLLLFGTGFRYAERLYVKLGQAELKPVYVGAQGVLAGLDQINLVLPPDLPPGLLNLQIISDGYASNQVQVWLAGE